MIWARTLATSAHEMWFGQDDWDGSRGRNTWSCSFPCFRQEIMAELVPRLLASIRRKSCVYIFTYNTDTTNCLSDLASSKKLCCSIMQFVSKFEALSTRRLFSSHNCVLSALCTQLIVVNILKLLTGPVRSTYPAKLVPQAQPENLPLILKTESLCIQSCTWE
jgi:hypothetical protein